MATQEATQGHAEHDDVYAAVFGLVGQKPNETYEGLVKVLPSIKDRDPAELKELVRNAEEHDGRHVAGAH